MGEVHDHSKSRVHHHRVSANSHTAAVALSQHHASCQGTTPVLLCFRLSTLQHCGVLEYGLDAPVTFADICQRCQQV